MSIALGILGGSAVVAIVVLIGWLVHRNGALADERAELRAAALTRNAALERSADALTEAAGHVATAQQQANKLQDKIHVDSQAHLAAPDRGAHDRVLLRLHAAAESARAAAREGSGAGPDVVPPSPPAARS